MILFELFWTHNVVYNVIAILLSCHDMISHFCSNLVCFYSSIKSITNQPINLISAPFYDRVQCLKIIFPWFYHHSTCEHIDDFASIKQPPLLLFSAPSASFDFRLRIRSTTLLSWSVFACNLVFRFNVKQIYSKLAGQQQQKWIYWLFFFARCSGF